MNVIFYFSLLQIGVILAISIIQLNGGLPMRNLCPPAFLDCLTNYSQDSNTKGPRENFL